MKTIFFDWNGTLLDDLSNSMDSMNEVLKRRNMKIMETKEEYRSIFEFPVIKYYERLAMIAPCMVMTFYMLPKQFETWDGSKKSYLYNTIDLLIVDEAGQVTTEIAAPSFSLAKKAVIVGDEYQIAPVWGIDTALDKSLAIQENVIKDLKEFEILEKYGITASNSIIFL